MSRTQKSKRVVAPAVALSAALAASFAFAPGSAAVATQEGDSMMEKPGPEHNRLTAMAGTWDRTVKFRMDPAGEFMESRSTETIKSVCGGFFIQSETDGQAMGMTWEGHTTLGYDTHKKKYVGTMMDNFGPYMLVMEGDYDAKTKTLTLWSQMFEPMSKKDVKLKLTIEEKSADETVSKMYMPGRDGKEFTIMEATAKRRK